MSVFGFGCPSTGKSEDGEDGVVVGAGAKAGR
jgi:hypothetical protein